MHIHKFYRAEAGLWPKVWPVWRCKSCCKVVWGAKKPHWWQCFGGVV